MLSSAIYEGKVRHCRHHPRRHQFDFRFFMVLLDLDELDQVFRGSWLWSASRPALCRFREQEHLVEYLGQGDLRQRLQRALADRGFAESLGPVRLLTQLSFLGFSMNPVSFYYCYDPAGERIVAVLAEVNNTPWGEQHLYLVPSLADGPRSTVRSEAIAKEFHVSPFMGQNMDYRMAFSAPGDQLAVKIENHERENHEQPHSGAKPRKLLDVTMALRRRSWSARALRRLLWVYPASSFQVFAGIYWQALRLYLKRIPFVPHPKHHQSPRVGSVAPSGSSWASEALESPGSTKVGS